MSSTLHVINFFSNFIFFSNKFGKEARVLSVNEKKQKTYLENKSIKSKLHTYLKIKINIKLEKRK